MKLELLHEYGINYQDGLTRCMGDVELYANLLTMFLSDDSFNRALTAYEFNDFETLFRSLHELKGASGTAGMTELYEAVCPLVDQLRDYQGDGKELQLPFERVDMAYRRARDGVSLALEQ